MRRIVAAVVEVIADLAAVLFERFADISNAEILVDLLDEFRRVDEAGTFFLGSDAEPEFSGIGEKLAKVFSQPFVFPPE